jgi:hypothetical protein
MKKKRRRRRKEQNCRYLDHNVSKVVDTTLPACRFVKSKQKGWCAASFGDFHVNYSSMWYCNLNQLFFYTSKPTVKGKKVRNFKDLKSWTIEIKQNLGSYHMQKIRQKKTGHWNPIVPAHRNKVVVEQTINPNA